MSGLGPFLRRYGLDALIVLAAVTSAVGTALRDDPHRLDGLAGWLSVGAVAAAVLSLLLRHRHPFGAPAAVWVGSAALSFADGRLVTSQGALYAAGLGAALLLGNVANAKQARLGLGIVLGGAVVVVANDPRQEGGSSLVVTPVLFGLGWLVGYALRERASQTEAAEERAARAERDRDLAARVAVAEERADRPRAA